MRVLLVDNYDSFTFNLAQLVGGLGAEVIVRRNDAVDVAGVDALAPTHVILSPGPGHPGVPRDFGVCAALVRRAAASAQPPLLGVCLGHQGIAHHLGGVVARAPAIVHGKTSPIRHRGDGLFAGLPDGFAAMRYHSWIVDPASLPAALEATAWTDDGLLMGLAHRTRPLLGVQFHPESFATEGGARILSNFLEISA